MAGTELTALTLKCKANFVETPHVRDLTERALSYLRAGYPVHLSGPAGTGKTTLAMHVAARLGRPVLLIHGNDEFGSSDLVGGQNGFRSAQVVDNFIHSVVKREETFSRTWVDNRLTTACKHGFTLIYDEFNRSRPEANNVLLGILEERLLELPTGRGSEGLVQVHPNFTALFTSNPEEYAGVHKTQDALLDRMITIRVGHHDRDTEVAITAAKSGLAPEAAARVVDVVRRFRAGGSNHRPTVRACVMIARVLALRGAAPDPEDPVFRDTCRDVLAGDALRAAHDGEAAGPARLDDAFRQVFGARTPRAVASHPTALAAAR